MPSFVRSERELLCDLLLELGPDAPTLCEGWTTRDLAAHLVVRESPAGVGIVVKPLSRLTAAVQGRVAMEDWPALVRRVRRPPFWSPLSWGPVEARVNLGEFFVHHEDVRRAQPGWRPRTLTAAQEQALWTLLRVQSGALFRHARTGVVLALPDGRTTVVRPGEGVVVQGPVGELVMYAFGRRGAAHVQVEGEPSLVARFTGAQLGL